VAIPTMVFGVLLIVLGLVGKFATGTSSNTALIPAAFGLPLVVLGFLSLRDNLRKHTMHLAALIGLVGFLAAAIRAVPRLPELVTTGAVVGTDGQVHTAAAICTVLMALLCGVFVGMCVGSFIAARRRQAAARASVPTGMPEV
jgi:hypothetical protein